MRAISITRPGGPEVLKLKESETPKPAKGEVLVRVHAAGVNRADLLQRAGNYPAPPDVSPDIPGMEFAGEVESLGEAAHLFKKGDRVFGLAAGGTYAEYVAVHERTLAVIPSNLSYAQAAAIPEAFITAYDALVPQCGLSAGETVLITAVGSGVGTAAVQIAAAMGAVALGTARSPAKLERARQLGLAHGIATADGKFAQAVNDATKGSGVAVVLELVGGNYLLEDLRCVQTKGRIILVGLLGGASCEMDLGLILRKRVQLKGTTLRARPLEEKIAAGQLLARHLAPMFEQGKLKPIVDATFPLAEADKAHELMQKNGTFGKVVLEV